MASLPLGWWDGQPTNLRFMIREIHRALGKRHFKFEDLLDQLTDRGYSVDVKTGNVFRPFIKAGTDPDGPSGMATPPQEFAGGPGHGLRGPKVS